MRPAQYIDTLRADDTTISCGQWAAGGGSGGMGGPWNTGSPRPSMAAGAGSIGRSPGLYGRIAPYSPGRRQGPPHYRGAILQHQPPRAQYIPRDGPQLWPLTAACPRSQGLYRRALFLLRGASPPPGRSMAGGRCSPGPYVPPTGATPRPPRGPHGKRTRPHARRNSMRSGKPFGLAINQGSSNQLFPLDLPCIHFGMVSALLLRPARPGYHN